MEAGPIYGVELINTLPLGTGSMIQQMPNRADLIQARRTSERTVAGYEVLLNSHHELTTKIDFLKSKGLTVGWVKESGKEPYLAYVIESGSELCDLATVNRLMDEEIRLAAAIKLLKRCYAAGHREGWQSGETNSECFEAVNNFLADNIGPDWGDRATGLAGGDQ